MDKCEENVRQVNNRANQLAIKIKQMTIIIIHISVCVLMVCTHVGIIIGTAIQ